MRKGSTSQMSFYPLIVFEQWAHTGRWLALKLLLLFSLGSKLVNPRGGEEDELVNRVEVEQDDTEEGEGVRGGVSKRGGGGEVGRGGGESETSHKKLHTVKRLVRACEWMLYIKLTIFH